MTLGTNGEPPPSLVVRLRRDIESLLAVRGAAVAAVRHEFRHESSPRNGAVHGWGTTIEPTRLGERMYLWFDAFDNDLVLEVGRFGWFEWFNLEVEDAVATDVVEVVSAVIEGEAWEYKTWRGRGRGCEVRTSDGRVRRASNGLDPVILSGWGTTRLRWRRQVSACSSR